MVTADVGRERDIFNIVYIVLSGHARMAGKTSQRTYIPFVMNEAMSWVGWMEFLRVLLRELELVANDFGSEYYEGYFIGV